MRLPVGPYFRKYLCQDSVEDIATHLGLMLKVFSEFCEEELSLECYPDVSTESLTPVSPRFLQTLPAHGCHPAPLLFVSTLRGRTLLESALIQIHRGEAPHLTIGFWDQLPVAGANSHKELDINTTLLESSVADTCASFSNAKQSFWEALTKPLPFCYVIGRTLDVYLDAKVGTIAHMFPKSSSSEARGVSLYHQIRGLVGHAFENQGNDVIRLGTSRKLARRFLAETDERLLRRIGQEELKRMLRCFGIGLDEWLALEGRFRF